jgi:hypothetical protein
MKISIKKILAREFLFLTLLGVLGFCFFLLMFAYNIVKHRQVERYKRDVQQKTLIIDSISKPYRTKIFNQEWYFEKLNGQFDLGHLKKSETFWSHSALQAKNGSILLLWNGKWKKEKSILDFFYGIGFLTADSLQSFIVNNTLNKTDFSNKLKAGKLKKDVLEIDRRQKKVEAKILTCDQRISFFKNFLIVLGLILFGLRYTYYGITWSITTLKNEH